MVRVALHAWGVGSALLALPHLLFALNSWSFGIALVSAISLPLPRAAVNRPVISGASGAAHALGLTCWPPGLQLAYVSTCSLLRSTTLSNSIFWPFLWPCCGLLFPSSLSDVSLSTFVFYPLCSFYIFSRGSSLGFTRFVSLKTPRVTWGWAACQVWLVYCRCSVSEQNGNRCPPGAPSPTSLLMTRGQTWLLRLECIVALLILSPGLPVGIAVLTCGRVKAPTPQGGWICFYSGTLLAQPVSYHLLSHPCHLSSIIPRSSCFHPVPWIWACVLPPPLTAQDLGSVACWGSPAWLQAAAGGAVLPKGGCDRNSLLKAPSGFPQCAIGSLSSDAWGLPTYWLRPAPAAALLRWGLSCFCFLARARQFITSWSLCLMPNVSPAWGYSVPWPSPPWTWLLPSTLLIFEPSWETQCPPCGPQLGLRVWPTIGISMWFWKEGNICGSL